MSDSPIVEAETLVRQKHSSDSERPNTSAGSISSLVSFTHPTMALTWLALEVAENATGDWFALIRHTLPQPLLHCAVVVLVVSCSPATDNTATRTHRRRNPFAWNHYELRLMASTRRREAARRRIIGGGTR